jgi:hypothetical protein
MSTSKSGPFRQWAMGPCFYCGRETYRCGPAVYSPYVYTRDHLIPKRLRGRVIECLTKELKCHDFTVTCCLQCNKQKGSKSAKTFMQTCPFNKTNWEHVKRVYALMDKRPKAAKSLATKLQ